jgi:hypothetical protein
MSEALGKIWNGFTCDTTWVDESGKKICRGHRIHSHITERTTTGTIEECIESCVGDCHAIDYFNDANICTKYENTKYRPFSFSLYPLYSHQTSQVRNCFVEYNKEECLSIEGALELSDSNLPSGCVKKDQKVFWNKEVVESVPSFQTLVGMCHQSNLPFFKKTSGTTCSTASLNKEQCQLATEWLIKNDNKVSKNMQNNIPIYESLATNAANGVYNGSQKTTTSGRECKKWSDRADYIYIPVGETCEDVKGYEGVVKGEVCSQTKDGNPAKENICNSVRDTNGTKCTTEINVALKGSSSCVNQDRLHCFKNYPGAKSCQESGQYFGTPSKCKANHKPRSYPNWAYKNWNCSICEDGYSKIWNGDCKPADQASGLDNYKGAATIQTSGTYSGSPKTCKSNHKPRSYPNWAYKNWNCSICEDGYTKIDEDGSCRKISELAGSVDLMETHFFAEDFTWGTYFTKMQNKWTDPSRWEYDCSNCSGASVCEEALTYLNEHSVEPFHTSVTTGSENFSQQNLGACTLNIYDEKPFANFTGRFVVVEDVNHSTTPKVDDPSNLHQICKKVHFADFTEAEHDNHCRNPKRESAIWCYTETGIDNTRTEECTMGVANGEWKQSNVPHGCYIKNNEEVWYNHMYNFEGCNEDLKTKYCKVKPNYADTSDFSEGTTLHTKKYRFNQYPFTEHGKDVSGPRKIEETNKNKTECEAGCRKNSECTSYTMIDSGTCRLNKISDALVSHPTITTHTKPTNIYDIHENKNVANAETTLLECRPYTTENELKAALKSCTDDPICEYVITKDNEACLHASLFDDVHSTFVSAHGEETIGKNNTTYECSTAESFDEVMLSCENDNECIGVSKMCKETGTCDSSRNCICPFDSDIKIKNTLEECRNLCKDSKICNYFFHDNLLGCYLFEDSCAENNTNTWGGLWEKKTMSDTSNEHTSCGNGADCLCKDAAMLKKSPGHTTVFM